MQKILSNQEPLEEQTYINIKASFGSVLYDNKIRDIAFIHVSNRV